LHGYANFMINKDKCTIIAQSGFEYEFWAVTSFGLVSKLSNIAFALRISFSEVTSFCLRALYWKLSVAARNYHSISGLKVLQMLELIAMICNES
jgi:hypothetical protein